MPSAEELLNDLRGLIEANRELTRISAELLAVVDRVSDRNKALGLAGMEERHHRLLKEAPEEYEKLRTEYTETSVESADSLMKIVGIVAGIERGYKKAVDYQRSRSN